MLDWFFEMGPINECFRLFDVELPENCIWKRMKNFNIMGVHWNIRLLGEGSHTKAIYKVENCLKREGGGWYPNAHYELTLELLKAIATLRNVFKVYNSNSWTRDQFCGMGPLSECLYQIFKYYQKTNSPIVKQNHHSK